MIQIARVAHVALRTPQLETMETYYTATLGLTVCARGDDGQVHLGCGDGGAAIELLPSDEASLDHVALALPVGLGAQETTAALSPAVIARAWEGDNDPMVAASLRIEDPERNVLQLIEPITAEMPDPAPARAGAGIRPVKLGHVATRATDVDALSSFYQTHLGFRFSDSIGDDFVFLRCNTDHHAVNFLRAERPGQVHHMAFQLEDFAHTRRACDELAAHGIPILWGPGRHGPGHNIFTYHLDPDGNIIELFADIDRMSDEGLGVFDWRPWHAGPQFPRRWDPDDPAAANSWGPMPPPMLMV